MLKRSPLLSEQVKAHLKARILSHEFADGRIPPEMELASELGVSRTTVREALSRLESEGSIYRKQGVGTFVNESGLQFKPPQDELWSYEAVFQAHGYTPATRVSSCERVAAPPEVAQTLRLSPREPVWAMRKLFLEDDRPVILADNFVPTRLAPAESLSEEDAQWPIYTLLERFGRISLAYYLTDLVPVAADATLERLLALPLRAPLLSFAETGYSPDHQPIVRAYSYFRDDSLRFRLIRRNQNLLAANP